MEDNFSRSFNNFVNNGLGIVNISLQNFVLRYPVWNAHFCLDIRGQHVSVILEVLLLGLFDMVSGPGERLEFEVL